MKPRRPNIKIIIFLVLILKRNLIYASIVRSEINGRYNIDTFRYSQNQRRRETKSKKYQKIIDKDKKDTVLINTNNREHMINDIIQCKSIKELMNINIVKVPRDGHNKIKILCNILNEDNIMIDHLKQCKDITDITYNINNISFTVKEIETLLSNHNSKSCNYETTVAYIKIKNIINSILFQYYEKELFRKLKWYSKINRKRSEARMLNNFEKKIRSPLDTLICIGDFEQRKHMKFKEPTKGKSFRKLFRNAGYDVFLVDEYNTSKINFFNGQENEKFRLRKNPRPWKDDIKEVHGLLRSKSATGSNPIKPILVNRDLNGSLNIRKKALCVIMNEEIPENLLRN